MMVLDRVDADADDLDAALVELGLDPGHVAELGGADRGEVLGVREQHRPAVADPLVEADAALGGVGLEVGRGVAERMVARILPCSALPFKHRLVWA